jgi:hypothetical protein
MSDNVKKAARHVQEATGISYQTCRALVTGSVVFTSQSDDCLVAAALESAIRWAEAKPDAKITACRCPKCAAVAP